MQESQGGNITRVIALNEYEELRGIVISVNYEEEFIIVDDNKLYLTKNILDQISKEKDIIEKVIHIIKIDDYDYRYFIMNYV